MRSEASEPTTLGSNYFSNDTKSVLNKVNDLMISGDSSRVEINKNFGDDNIPEHLFNACARVKIFTSSVSMHLDKKLINSIFRQIDLMHETEDWDSEEAPVELDSFRTFLRWLMFSKTKRSPSIGLSSVGNIAAGWIYKMDKIELEFYPNDKVSWIITRNYNHQVERSMGNSNINRLLTLLEPFRLNDFFGNLDEDR